MNPSAVLLLFQHLTFGAVISNCSTHLICHFEEAPDAFRLDKFLKRLRTLIPIKDDAS